jgi:hypothetical protein
MNRKYQTFLACSMTMLLFACQAEKKLQPPAAEFANGSVRIVTNGKETEDGHEVRVRSRFQLKKELNSDASTYFQYQLGKNIKLIVNNDTIAPSLSYYVPLIDGKQKEIDCTYLLSAEESKSFKRLIVDDNLLDLNQINISFK